MICHGARQRIDAFYRVEPVHRTTRGSCASSVREPARVTNHLWIGEKRIGIETENNRRSIEPEYQIDVASGDLPQPGEPVLVADRVVGRPLQLRITLT